MGEELILSNIDYESVSYKHLLKLLHSSTITEEMGIYASYVDTINNGDLLSKLELVSILVMNQRNPFYDMEVISNRAINIRLNEVLLNDRL